MIKRIPIIYSLAFLAYLTFAFTIFPVLSYNASIPLIPLIALGSWIGGRRFGLWLLLTGMIYFYILYQYYADIYIHYYERFLAPLLCLAIIELFAILRHNLNAIKTANQNLGRMVAERTTELNTLTDLLIRDSEQRRVLHGQWLHDGIGQYLTGIQLYCASLADQLLDEGNPSASIAFALRNQCHSTHNQIRHLARMLFPIKIGDVGLITALHELSSCFIDLKNVKFTTRELGELPELPEDIALQMYRICQENANFAIFHLNASQVDIQIRATKLTYTVTFGHNGSAKSTEGKELLNKLIDYRLEQISGTASSGYSTHYEKTIIYTIPNPEQEG